MTARPTFVLVLRPEPEVDPVRALRQLLKVAGRSLGLRCLSVHEQQDPPAQKSATGNGTSPHTR